MTTTTTDLNVLSLNDLAIQYFAAQNYQEALVVLHQCLEYFLPAVTLAELQEKCVGRMPLSPQDWVKKELFPMSQDSCSLHKQEVSPVSSSSFSCLHPLPTAMMLPSNDATANLFRECFMMLVVDLPVNDVPNEIRWQPCDTFLCATVLLFNLGLVHHLRGMSTSTKQLKKATSTAEDDIRNAEKFYRLALTLGIDSMANSSNVVAEQQPGEEALATTATTHADDSSARWLLILATVNNLGCIANETANFETVQDCLAWGMQAMKCIDLPLVWSNQFEWCSPSPAA